MSCPEGKSPSSVSPEFFGWRFLTCRVLPDLIVTAATRPNPSTSDLRSASGPGPLALLPVARSPSRSCYHDRWWALTPPVRPLPALLTSAGGNPFCCGCSQNAALAGLPPLTVSWGDSVPRLRDWESGGSSEQHAAVYSEPLPSDGSPICPTEIIPRDWNRIKYRVLRYQVLTATRSLIQST